MSVSRGQYGHCDCERLTAVGVFVDDDVLLEGAVPLRVRFGPEEHLGTTSVSKTAPRVIMVDRQLCVKGLHLYLQPSGHSVHQEEWRTKHCRFHPSPGRRG